MLRFETPRTEIDPLRDSARSPPAVRQHDPATASYFPTKSVSQAFGVTVVVKKFSPAITASNDLVVGPGELQAEASRLPISERSESKNRFTLTSLPLVKTENKA